MVLVAERHSTICTGGISNIVQMFANKNVTLHNVHFGFNVFLNMPLYPPLLLIVSDTGPF